ncbi:hypothetical protein [Streptomyces sp. UNOC14_S4]|uniref:hypothetical protein n=1 Tax=Streptomyces sp. UNOC14_S4 TaxID=2872340 RepID=UPI001E59811D|nr:hypothetical protein [Streptomyces sp. UNOC14_S4]MCC3772434.1 hypothetical protein [Streptomyces sp. UNOC14_S4]
MSTEGGTTDSNPDRTPEPRGRWRHPRLAVASVAAAMLLAGGGGAYWASTAADGTDSGAAGGAGSDGAPPPLVLDGYRPGGGSPQGIAVGEPDPNGVRYRAEGTLPEGPRKAPVFLPRDEVRPDEVASLAKALSVPGTPRLEQGVWRVGGAPGADEPVLQVKRQGPGDWSYSRYGTPGGGCVHPGPGPQKEQASAPASDGCPQFRGIAPGDARAVTQERAKQAAAPVLKALGQDGAKLDAHQTFGAVRAVRADPVVNGTPTYGRQTTLEVGSDAQVVKGAGQLQAPVKGAEYPLVSAAEALKELNEHSGPGKPAGIGGCATAVPYGQDAPAPCPASVTAGKDPAVVSGASFALAQAYVRGREALVPSWVFQVRMPGAGDGAAAVPVVQTAVDPKFLAGPSPAPSGTAPATDTPKASPMRVDSYSQDGRKLVLHFWGGTCNDYTASAEQSSGAVTVKVVGTEKKPGQMCVMMAERMDRTVTLDKPLDDRKVVDAVTGEPVPADTPGK